MRVLTAAEMKNNRRGARTHKIPAEGSQLRQLYDLLQASKGVPLDISAYQILGRNSARAIADLTDYYGLDVRNLASDRHPRWVLAGEWFGRVYVDYVAERLKEGKSERD